MKVTIKDVAKQAGVGIGTVSRVLNNGSVTEKTRAKVEKAIQMLNYKPNTYARGLKSNRTNTIALIIPTIWHPFFSEFVHHIETYLEKNGLKLLLCNAEHNSEKEYEYIQMVKQNKVDGIIGITYSHIEQYISSSLPFVSIDRHFSEEVVYVTADNEAGGILAAQELIKRGCQSICFIGGHQTVVNETKKRRQAFESECKKQNIHYHVLDMREPVTDLDNQLSAFFNKHPEIDGVFAINDTMALDVIHFLNGINKSVPKDIQVIGFDGQRYSEYAPYLVSSIAQPIELMAKTAVELLINLIEHKEVAQRTILPVQFVPGATTLNRE
ncbi:LacI family DNA-binding transcriptional regulator [Amphibacillus indicireducens]|uniref:LacI family DNA-binding transcriptional regulator n=1 Tax=Amphibacillus indicireducens TaxID=1076330 RepID=A0ABP7V3E2_9BACI